MTEDPDQTAREIADQGRDALVGRLRPAFELAVEARADTLTLDDEQLERMVQRAADRADGLQWRRALASVASEQMGIGLGEALAHPAVVRAHELVGAPSYEEALAAVTGGQAMPAATVAASEPESAQEPESAEERAVEPGEPESEPEAATEPEPETATETATEPEMATGADAAQPESEPQPEKQQSEPRTEPLLLSAVHIGGIANLPEGASDLELRFSDSGLDIAREGRALGRLTWREITAIDTPEPAGRRRRRQRADGTVVIRSASGRAAFEVPGMSAEELREQLAPLLEDHLA
jgi:hypothetical protein